MKAQDARDAFDLVEFESVDYLVAYFNLFCFRKKQMAIKAKGEAILDKSLDIVELIQQQRKHEIFIAKHSDHWEEMGIDHVVHVDDTHHIMDIDRSEVEVPVDEAASTPSIFQDEDSKQS